MILLSMFVVLTKIIFIFNEIDLINVLVNIDAVNNIFDIVCKYDFIKEGLSDLRF
jgi:hypothetical protein